MSDECTMYPECEKRVVSYGHLVAVLPDRCRSPGCFWKSTPSSPASPTSTSGEAGDQPESRLGKLTGMDAMAIDHAIAQCVVAGGVRRCARMSMMHWGDPQIMDFITSKASGINHWTTNIWSR